MMHDRGYAVHLVFVALDNPKRCMARVRDRVAAEATPSRTPTFYAATPAASAHFESWCGWSIAQAFTTIQAMAIA